MNNREARKMIENAVSSGRKTLLGPEAKGFISAWGIPVPRSASGKWSSVRSQEEMEHAVAKLSPPFVLKAVSPDILHKSDVGGVVTGIMDIEGVNRGWEDIIKNLGERAPKARIDGFMVEETASKGVEVIMGGLRDPQFGPVVMFGIGGVAVELMKDVGYRLAPLNKKEALDMISEVRSSPLLSGFRGSRPVDMDKLADAVLTVSRIITEFEEIQEIEINPLIASEEGVMAVDARVVLR